MKMKIYCIRDKESGAYVLNHNMAWKLRIFKSPVRAQNYIKAYLVEHAYEVVTFVEETK